MLTGDSEAVASEISGQLGLDEYHAQLLPADKVNRVEELLATKGKNDILTFAGDGINDAPVLMPLPMSALRWAPWAATLPLRPLTLF